MRFTSRPSELPSSSGSAIVSFCGAASAALRHRRLSAWHGASPPVARSLCVVNPRPGQHLRSHLPPASVLRPRPHTECPTNDVSYQPRSQVPAHQCKARGMHLCSYDEYCPNGPRTAPKIGYSYQHVRRHSTPHLHSRAHSVLVNNPNHHYRISPRSACSLSISPSLLSIILDIGTGCPPVEAAVTTGSICTPAATGLA